MVDIRYLERQGVSAAAYKKIFSAAREDWPRSVQSLVNHVANRIRDGRTYCLENWRAYHAIDLAYEIPFNQTTPTLVQDILSRHLTLKDTQAALDAYGLAREELFLNVTPEGQQGEVWVLNPPVFFKLYIPLVKAYTTIRLAKIFNERNREPLLDFRPLKQTEQDQVLCEVVTDLINNISRQYGYSATLRQCILQMLKYGLCLTFPQEEWHCEKQTVFTGETKEDGTEATRTITVREGLRYLLPDPTRTYYDLSQPLTSINTDTGTRFAGHWHVMTYGDIIDNRDYWNRKSIFSGTNWFQSPLAGNYFNEIFPCQVKNFPGNWAWGQQLNREDKTAYYSSNQRDKPIFITDHFEKIIPRDWGLADYKYPVWHRFTIAADDTPIWVEPCAYTPSWMMGYDYDVNAGRNSSLALELIPWQDQLGNILSQIILTAKQNLARVVFYDDQQISVDEVRRLKNQGERQYRSVNWIPFDSLKNRVAGVSHQNAFFPVNFGNTSIAELLQLIPVTLNIMERVLQISAQEAGSAASHQQSKAEIIETGTAGTQRVALTASSVDEGIDAWERQLFEGAMAYKDASFIAQVSADIPNAHKILEDLGFRVEHTGNDKILVHGKKSLLLRLEGFAKTTAGMERDSDKETAQVLMQTVGVIASQDDLRMKVGAKNMLLMIELAARLASPRLAGNNFRLREQPQGKNGEISPQMIQAIKQAQQATLEHIGQQFAQPAAQALAKTQGEVQQLAGGLQQLQQVVQQLQGVFDKLSQMVDKNAVAARDSQTKLAIQQQEFQAEQQRKDAELQAKMQRDDAELAAKLQRDQIETSAKIESRRQESEAKAEATKKATKAKVS